MRLTEGTFAADALAEMEMSGDVRNKKTDDDTEEDASSEAEIQNMGAELLDASCFPQDIHFPTDVGLLNRSRELLEQIIDFLYRLVSDKYTNKPRTYRLEARTVYLGYAKARKHTVRKIRKQIRSQLQYVGRDLRIVQDLVTNGADLTQLPNELQEKLKTIEVAYQQQKGMYDQDIRRCDDRIVSISQPHVRPIVRGKEHNPTEFGAKVAIAMVSGYAFITSISWNNVAESTLLPAAAEQYKRMFGFYPRVIIGDRAYTNQVNRAWCQDPSRNIRLSGPRKGRKSEEFKREEAILLAQEGRIRNAVEGKFGTVKRKFGLGLIMPKLEDTSASVIAMGFFVSNMERRLRRLGLMKVKKRAA